eukprot:1193962-Prorocentrum_minimum.AAC.1
MPAELRGEGEVVAAVCGVRNQLLKSGGHALLKLDAIILSHVAGEREVLQVAAHTHAHGGVAEAEGGQVELATLRQALHLGEVPAVDVLEVAGDVVVVADHLYVHTSILTRPNRHRDTSSEGVSLILEQKEFAERLQMRMDEKCCEIVLTGCDIAF